MNVTAASNMFPKKFEYLSVTFNLAQATTKRKRIVKNYRRCVRALKKQQRKLMSNYGESVIDSNDVSL